MSTPSQSPITALLQRWSAGDEGALEKLFPMVYDELRRLAAGSLRRERSAQTLQPTALVHEAYLRLVDQNAVQWQNRSHFYAIAAQAMRRVLVDRARRRAALRRKDVGLKVTLSEAEHVPAPSEKRMDFLALDNALNALAAIDPRQVRLVELRYFGGLTIAETAEVLKLSPATVKREWTHARAWLFKELNRD